MPATRFPKRPKPTQSPRSSLNILLHTKIDAFLKSARQCTQQVTPFESGLQDEMRVLERLYYKGVNQHRSALFWRKVKEVRRLGKRVLEVRLGGLLDDLRYSFYCVGDDEERNPKILKGAWSQVPDAKFLLFIFERMRDILELINTTKERLLKAYHSLSLMMQTGAFLQLIVLLTAIVSRLNAITNELGTALHSFLDNFEILLDALGHLHQERKTVSSANSKRPELSEKRRILSSAGRIDSLHTDIGEEFGEDLGSAVQRKRTGSTPEASIRREDIETNGQQEGHILDIDRDPIPTPIPTSLPLPGTPSIIVVKTEVVVVDSTSNPTNDNHGKTSIGKTNMKDTAIAKVRKKKKKRKDEIDEIFGFL